MVLGKSSDTQCWTFAQTSKGETKEKELFVRSGREDAT